MLPMKTELVRNQGIDSLQVPYIARVVCDGVINRGPHFDVPVRAAYIGLQKTLSVEVAGFRLQTEHLNAVAPLVERLIEGVARAARIPHYVFIARDAGIVYPVYTVGDEVLAPTPNGPLFQHVELAVVRDRLTDYLHSVRVLGKEGKSDKLHVRGVHRRTLQLVRPVFYLKKRGRKENDFWAPVFPSIDAPCIYAYAANDRREVPVEAGREVLTLRASVATALQADGRLANSNDLRPDRLFMQQWQQLASHLTPLDDQLVVHGIHLPLFQEPDGLMIACETRPLEERVSLFLGDDRADLLSRIRFNFTRRGLFSPDHVD